MKEQGIKYQKGIVRFFAFLLDGWFSVLITASIYLTLWKLITTFWNFSVTDEEVIESLFFLQAILFFLKFEFINRVLFPIIFDGITLGKLLAEIKVISLNNKPLNIKRLTSRLIVMFLIMSFQGIGYLVVGISIWSNEKGQAIHDYISDTTVIKDKGPRHPYHIMSFFALFGLIAYVIILATNL